MKSIPIHNYWKPNRQLSSEIDTKTLIFLINTPETFPDSNRGLQYTWFKRRIDSPNFETRPIDGGEKLMIHQIGDAIWARAKPLKGKNQTM